MEVKSNATLANFANGSMRIYKVKHKYTKECGAGINLLVVNNYSQLFRFYEVINNFDNIKFWTTKLTKCIIFVKKSFHNILDIARIGTDITRYLDEAFGDRVATVSLCHHHDMLSLKADGKERVNTCKALPIFTNRLQEHLRLDDKDSSFM